MRNKKGFTLVEIMIVVAIIGLLAAIAIPGLLRSRHNANESAAIGSIRTISTSCESFRAAQVTPAYPTALTALSSASPPYIDSVLANAVDANNTKQGYFFTYGTDASGYYCIATPQTVGSTGTRYFYVDETGVLRNGTTAITTRALGTAAAAIQ